MSALELVVDELETKARAWPDRARAAVIVDDATFLAAGQLTTEIKALRKEIAETFNPIITKAHEAHQEALAQKKRHETPLIEAEGIIKRALSDYDTERQRKADEERRRLEAQARALEEERLLADAIAAEQDGDGEAADQILAEPVVLAPVATIAPAKAEGISFREDWTFELVSIVDVARHVAEHPEDANMLTLNTSAVRQMVRARKNLFRVPGIRAYATKTVAATARR
jgi:hypothetical protein